jgi:hypothetical protein
MTAQSNSQNVKVGIEQGATRLFVKNGGVLDIEPGGVLSQGGVPLKIARGQLTTVTRRRHGRDRACDGRLRRRLAGV